MEHYVTIFNNLFLPQGLVLYDSLQKYSKNSILWVICVDIITKNILEKLNLINLNIVSLDDVETSELQNQQNQ